VRREAPYPISNPLKRALAAFNGRKAVALEKRVLGQCDLMTAISDIDCEAFEQLAPELPKIVLRPGYDGYKRDERVIDANSARVAVMVGSFDWFIKRRNLIELLDAYVEKRKLGEIEFTLRIAGSMSRELQDLLAAQYSDVEIAPSFLSLGDVLGDARVALVVERFGSGFKLKVLDYIFSRVPIVAFSSGMAGAGLEPGKAYSEVPDVNAALLTTQGLIDDFGALNDLQETAFSVSSNAFAWEDRAQALLAFLKAHS